MRCDQEKHQLWAYYDQSLAPEQRQAIEEHLAGCANCRGSLQEWTAISRQVFPKQPAQAPTFLWTRILAEIQTRQETGAGAWWYQWRWMRRVATAMTLIVGMAAGAVFYEDQKGNALDSLLQGILSPQQAAEFAEAAQKGDQVTAWLVQPSVDEANSGDKEI